MSALERLKCVFQAFFGSGGDCRTAVGSRILLHSSRGQHSVTGLPQVLKIRTSHSKLGEILGFFFQITTRRLVHCRHVTGHSENYLDFWVYLKLSIFESFLTKGCGSSRKTACNKTKVNRRNSGESSWMSPRSSIQVPLQMRSWRLVNRTKSCCLGGRR